ncbi:MAG: cytochrome b N-terminal domain-containing protein [Vicinamibacteria bacterium]|nr:cytochrome b N-terminal domain-containing protein [Vicinamibacteria bacterium]
MAALAHPTERLVLRLLTWADGLCNRLYTQRFNPLYQSGTIVVALYLALVVTGLWLTLFYRIGTPWESVASLTASPWTGNWVRGLHRYASDLAVIATAVHMLRMFAEGRSWGARALAWVTGGLLLLLLMICGWTGYVMVWDTFGEHLAREGARMLDALPVLSEPTSRAFTGEQPLPTAFFFLNLFAHIGIPLAMGVVFWLHVRRLARPLLLPPRPVMWLVIGALTATAVVWPLAMAPQADPLVLPLQVPADLFFAFWIPFTQDLSGGSALLLATALGLALLAVPGFTARRGAEAAAPSVVDEDICVGCVQCSLDCPYGAITMFERTSRRSDLVARVDSALCVSCGICAGSCSPMGVGPPGRTGRDQMDAVREFISAPQRRAGETVVICCDHGAGACASDVAAAGGVPYPVGCAGNLHTSVIEILLRGGAGGVLVLACPPRDCWSREGPRWLAQRVYHARAAELQPRVSRTRVRIAHASAGDRAHVVETVRAFAADAAALGPPDVGDTLDVGVECEAAPPRGEP